jgi:hypothetical protein
MITSSRLACAFVVSCSAHATGDATTFAPTDSSTLPSARITSRDVRFGTTDLAIFRSHETHEARRIQICFEGGDAPHVYACFEWFTHDPPANRAYTIADGPDLQLKFPKQTPKMPECQRATGRATVASLPYIPSRVPHRERSRDTWTADFTLVGEAHVEIASDVDCTQQGFGVIHFDGRTDHARVWVRDDE